MKYLKQFNENLFGNLIGNHPSWNSYYKYLGETNSPTWSSNLREILHSKSIITNYPYSNDITNDNIKKINDLISSFMECKYAIYDDIKNVINSRFGNCWYLKNKISGYNWDICLQSFRDDWYLVRFGSGDGSWSFWYLCDQFEGLKQLIENKLED